MSLFMGGAAGTVAMTITFPCDVVRKRLVIQGSGLENKSYTGIIDVVRQTAKTEGLKGFYRGILPCYLKVIPSAAIVWCVIELCKRVGGP